MRGDFEVTARLPLAQVDCVVGPLTLRQAMQSMHDAATGDRPEYLSAEEWSGLYDLAARIRRLGTQQGTTAQQLLDMADLDTSVIQQACKEVVRREAAFRGAVDAAPAGDGPGSEGDGVATRSAVGAADG